jgi:hypothetical protein
MFEISEAPFGNWPYSERTFKQAHGDQKYDIDADWVTKSEFYEKCLKASWALKISSQGDA